MGDTRDGAIDKVRENKRDYCAEAACVPLYAFQDDDGVAY